MSLMYVYSDAYLAPLITQDREDRAVTDVAVYGAFDSTWTERLVRLRAYILACIESTKSSEDLFAQKLTHYGKEFQRELTMARAALSGAGTTGSASLVSIPLERA